MFESKHFLENCLITGGHGMVGKNFHFGLKPTSKELDITNTKSITTYISKQPNISCIIHLASINIRDSEKSNKNAVDININGTINMLKESMNRDIPFVYVSSGAVFSSFNENEKFNEKTIPNPNCMYGYTKYAAEKMVMLYNKSFIIRTGWLFGGHQKSHYKFVENVFNNLQTNTVVNASNNFVGSPTYVVDFVEKLKEIITTTKYGIYHVVNDGVATGYDIAHFIANQMNRNSDLIRSVGSFDIPNSGPHRSDTEVLVTNYEETKMRHWKDALQEYTKLYFSNQGLFKQQVHETVKVQPWNNRTTCRLCNHSSLYLFFKLEPTPPANHFLKTPQPQTNIPLDVCVCTKCHHVQLLQIINPSTLYSNYLYVSSTSHTMTEHLKSSVKEFTNILQLSKTSNILEIGANDGVCISHLIDCGFTNVVGIDPAQNINSTHTLPIICDFFGSDAIPKIKDYYNSYSLIYAFHCCAHIENIQDVFETIYNLLDDTGVFIMEVGYFYEVFKQHLFDVIYHEHIDYHTCTSMQTFCEKNKLKLFKVQENDIQGGSIQFFITKNMDQSVDESVFAGLQKERDIGLYDVTKLSSWKNIVIQNGNDINYILNSLLNNGKTIVGYGAPAKLTTFMYQYKISNTAIKYIIEDNMYKHDLYTPGLHIKIQPPSILEIDKIDYIIVFAWNFSTEIIRKLDNYRKNGGRIIIPFPEIKII